MKKITAMLLTTMLLLSLCACGGNNQQQGSSTPNSPAAPVENTGETYTWKLGTIYNDPAAKPEYNAFGMAVQKFCELVEKKTDGQVKVEPYYSSVLGGSAELWGSLRDNEIQVFYGQPTDVDFVMLGCPHYSIDQVEYVARLVEGRRIKDGVNFWVFVPQSIKDLAVRCGYVEIIERAGGLVMRDCCPALGQFKPRGAKVMATDSGKQAHYLPNFTGIESWYGSTEECVEAAITGKWGGAL